MIQTKRFLATLIGTLFFFIVSPLHFAQHVWQKHAKGYEGSSWAIIKNAYATVLISAENALQKLLPEATSTAKETKTISAEEIEKINKRARLKLDPATDNTFEFTVAKANGEIIGYAAQDAVPGKWGLIYYMIAFKPNGQIKDVVVLSYEEQRGKPIAKKRFLKQFRKKSTKNKIRLMKDIKGVTGASMSSRGMADGVRKMTHVLEVAYGL